jgi:hypothetical protein
MLGGAPFTIPVIGARLHSPTGVTGPGRWSLANEAISQPKGRAPQSAALRRLERPPPLGGRGASG